jgi:hypothetical protein
MGSPNTGEIYEGSPRDPGDVGLSGEQAEHLRTLEINHRKQELGLMADKREAARPDLRTLEGTLSYLDYHAPNHDTLPRHGAVNEAFQALVQTIWNALPDGPGKTIAIRAIGRARMECNSCIANGGQ